MSKCLKYILISSFILLGLYYSDVSAFEYRYTKSGFKYVVHKHNELAYQRAWCSAHNGIEEYENEDGTRIDCLTSSNAVEFDFANKWQESIGQAEYYALMSGKKGMVVLILEDPETEMKYFEKVKKVAEHHNLDVEYVTMDILKLKNGKCQLKECKCHKK